MSATLVSAAAAVGIAVVVGGGTAGIQTPLVAPAAGVTIGPAVVPGDPGPELSVRVLRPARLPMTGTGPDTETAAPAAEPVAAAPEAPGPPRVRAVAAHLAPQPEPLVVPPAPAPAEVAPLPAPAAVPAPVAAPAPVVTAKAKAKAKPPERPGAMGSESGTERAQTAEPREQHDHEGKAKGRRDRGERQD